MFKQLKHTWSTKNYGIKIDHTSTERITNLRFADDVLLIAPTLPQVTRMLTDLKQEARKYGLQIHPDKTQILSNVSQRQGRNAKKTVDIDGEEVSIIPLDANTKYLGRSLSLGEYNKT